MHQKCENKVRLQFFSTNLKISEMSFVFFLMTNHRLIFFQRIYHDKYFYIRIHIYIVAFSYLLRRISNVLMITFQSFVPLQIERRRSRFHKISISYFITRIFHKIYQYINNIYKYILSIVFNHDLAQIVCRKFNPFRTSHTNTEGTVSQKLGLEEYG